MALRTRAELQALNVMNPDFQAAIAADPLPEPPPGSDIFALREHRANFLKERRHLYPIPGSISEVSERIQQIPTRDGTTISVKIYTPTAPPSPTPDDGAPGAGPLIVMFHEGGFCFGDFSDEDQNCRLFARSLRAVCVNVEYRLAPEHPFPKCIEDSWDALRWAAANASASSSSLLPGADPSKGFIVGGASAGGNVSAVLAHLARDERLSPPLTGQYLCVPAVCPWPAAVPDELAGECNSMQENLRDPVLHPDSFGLFKEAYRPDPESELFAPMLWPGGHAGLPKAYLQVAGMDPLRDEALVYDRLLREAGVRTRCEVYPGFGHMFWTNFPKMEASRAFVDDTLEGVKWLLEKS